MSAVEFALTAIAGCFNRHMIRLGLCFLYGCWPLFLKIERIEISALMLTEGAVCHWWTDAIW